MRQFISKRELTRWALLQFHFNCSRDFARKLKGIFLKMQNDFKQEFNDALCDKTRQLNTLGVTLGKVKNSLALARGERMGEVLFEHQAQALHDASVTAETRIGARLNVLRSKKKSDAPKHARSRSY
jgi:hypothetical protein